MTGSLVIREVVAADVPAVVEHVRRVLAEFGIAFGVGAESDDELFHLPGSYADRGGAFWVVVTGTGELVGTAGVVPVADDTFELRKMYLLPQTRGQGVGAALLARAVEYAVARGARRMVLDTVDQMRDAIAFYERHGFVRDDREIRASRCTRGYVRTLA